MMYSEIIDEDVNRRDWTFFHGTKSEAFDKFNPTAASKGEQFWNPLGNGMYATNNPRFAASFGPNVHKVIVPTGCRYKRITPAQWQSTGWGLVFRALKVAFKRAGQNYDHWDNGTPIVASANKKMSRDQILDTLIACLSKGYNWSPEKIDTVRRNAENYSTEQLLAELKNKARFGPRDRDHEKGRKITEFRVELRRLITQHSPYESLYESAALVEIVFGSEIAAQYTDILPKISDAVFGKYDFIVFTETNDVIGTDDGKSSVEVVIFNPQLQRTVNRDLEIKSQH